MAAAKMVEPGQDLLLTALSESGISPNDLFDIDSPDMGLATPPPAIQQSVSLNALELGLESEASVAVKAEPQAVSSTVLDVRQPPSTTTFVLNQINQLPTLGTTLVMTKTTPVTSTRQTITVAKIIQTSTTTRPSVTVPVARNTLTTPVPKDQIQLKDLLKNNSLNELMKLKPPPNIAPPVATAATDMSNGAVKKETSTKEVTRIWVNDLKMRSFSPTMKMPVTKEEEEPEEEDEEEMGHAETYAEYMPIKLKIGLRHPDPVVETSSLSSVTPPEVWYKSSIPEESIDSGWLSALQLEAITYAAQVLSLFSVSNDLKYDAERDLRDIGAKNILVHSLNKFKYGKISSKHNGSVKKGIIFATYSSLIGESQSGGKYKTRLKQLLHWCGDNFDGVIVFDECHKAKNLCPVGSSKPTKTGLAVLELQNKLPKARVIYASATGASEPRNMAYMNRLGIWGEGTPFREFSDFIQAVERRGVGAMEIVAMDMKLRGMYIARQLSFSGVTFKIDEVHLSQHYVKMYNKSVKCRNPSEPLGQCKDKQDSVKSVPLTILGPPGEHTKALIRFSADPYPRGGLAVKSLAGFVDSQRTSIPRNSFRELCATLLEQGADAWVSAREKFQQAADLIDAEQRMKKSMWGQFWSAHQRFFKYLCIASKVKRVVQLAREEIKNGKCVVIGLQSTGEARTLEALEEGGGELNDFVSTAKNTGFLSQGKGGCFNPSSRNISQLLIGRSCSACWELTCLSRVTTVPQDSPCKEDKVKKRKGEEMTREVKKARKTGGLAGSSSDESFSESEASENEESDNENPWLIRKEHKKNKEKKKKKSIDPDSIQSALLASGLGSKRPSRKGRVVSNDDGSISYESRSELDVPVEILNITEKQRFMDGDKNIAIISEAASSGISLQADRRAKNQRRRVHMTLELPWSADRAIQQFGRTHRSNQVTAPEYVFLISELAGEQRFASIVAKRLESLGALTHGDRRATETRDLSRFNFDNKYGRNALEIVMKSIVNLDSPLVSPPADYPGEFFKDVRQGLIGVGLINVEDRSGILTLDKDYNNIGKFLNRILGMEVHQQNALFQYFSDTLNAISVERGMSWEEATKLWSEQSGSEDGFYLSLQIRNSKKTAILMKEVNPKKKLFLVYRPNTGKQLKLETYSEIKKKYKKVSDVYKVTFFITRVSSDDAVTHWVEQYTSSADTCTHAYWRGNCKRAGLGLVCEVGLRCRTYYVLCGSVLSVWTKVEGVLASVSGTNVKMQIVRLRTEDGQRIVGKLDHSSKLRVSPHQPPVDVGSVATAGRPAATDLAAAPSAEHRPLQQCMRRIPVSQAEVNILSHRLQFCGCREAV
ncbi:putative Strawberry notch 1-like protein, partial [Naja naja]